DGLPADVVGGGAGAALAAARHRDGGGHPPAADQRPAGVGAGGRVSIPGHQRRAGAGGGPTDRDHSERVREVTMLDELKEEEIVNKVGGRFKLSTLIQKRMVMLNTGAKALVEVKGGDKMAAVIQEILQDKIYLDASGAVQARGMSAG